MVFINGLADVELDYDKIDYHKWSQMVLDTLTFLFAKCVNYLNSEHTGCAYDKNFVVL